MATAVTDAPVAATPKPAIDILNVGPVSGHFHIGLETGFGVYEMQGGIGTGKSHVLRCVDSLIRQHAVDLTVTDGQLEGRVSGLGVDTPVGGRKRSRGDLELNSLESEKYSLSDITDPQIKDPEKADAVSIKALASICRVEITPADFYSICGGQPAFESVVNAKRLEITDPVTLANGIKKDYETAAQAQESKADIELDHAKACEEALKGLVLTAPHDEAQLNAAVDAAVRRDADLKAQAATAARAANEVKVARDKLKSLTEGYRGKTIDQAKLGQTVAKTQHGDAIEERLRIERQIAELQAKLRTASAVEAEKKNLLDAADREVNAAEHHQNLVAQCQSMIESQEAISSVPDKDLLSAADNVKQARAAQEQGVRVRDGLKTKERQQKHLDANQAAKKRGEQYRAIAAQTFDVLAKAVKLDSLKIKSVNGVPRLVVYHPKRKQDVLFRDLSAGERTKATMGAVANLLDSPGVFPISQELWQSLGDKEKMEIHEYAKVKKLYVFCAQVNHGQLRCRYYGEAA